jgi:hypothetical protein
MNCDKVNVSHTFLNPSVPKIVSYIRITSAPFLYTVLFKKQRIGDLSRIVHTAAKSSVPYEV